MANTVNNPSGGSVDGGGARPFDFSGIDTKNWINDFPVFNTSRPVVCKDGSTKIQQSSPNAKYMDACINNGGVDNQKRTESLIDDAKKQYEDALAKAQSQAQSQGSNTKEPIYYILVTAGVLVAGYFAYKKFKK